ncbi:MAG: beta-lactamase family protein [Acidobacteriota bacterium]|nr:MAG: beta-lactamase family protein [Acidobacteriota bacterium]
MKPIKSLLTILILLAGSSLNTTAQTDSPAVARLKALIEIVNSHDRQAAERFINENYSADFLKIPMTQHLNFIFRTWDQSRGYDFHGIQDTTADTVTALVKNRLTGGWEAVAVRIEAAEPHKISGIGRRDPKPPAGTMPTKRLTDAEIARTMESFVKKLADADAFSGTVLIANGDKVIYKGAFGTANKDFNAPNTIDTKFNLGSMNKMFTSVAIAQLVEQGKLSFDDPLSKFLPEFPNKQAAEKIRIKHLLTHTAGLGSYFNQKYQESSRALYRSVDDMMKLADDKDVAFEPGTKWAYSNTGMLVLGKVIEKASGQNYFDYIRRNIYKPAGMINSDSYDLDRVNPNLAVGYEKVFTDSGVAFRNNVFSHVIRGGPAGGGYSTVEDLLGFSLALRSNKLVGAEYVKLLTSPKPELSSPGYGYGFIIEDNGAIAGHGGGFEGISSNLDMFLENGYTAVVMSNYGGASFPVFRKIRELINSGRELKTASR